ncbi:MAG: helix-turn-helix domain-containing protein [Gammaproteobacteria bacterium]|nr:helix-turn-helix domain-containing protein [Gammaproteobacteria bacterium]
MARRSKRPLLTLPEEQRRALNRLTHSHTARLREVERARVLLRYAEGCSITEIQRQVGVSRPTIYKCIDKALTLGVMMGLKDHDHRPHAPRITDVAKDWVVSLAGTRPRDMGVSADSWTLSALATYVREHAESASFECLAKASKSTIWRILNEKHVKPRKISQASTSVTSSD